MKERFNTPKHIPGLRELDVWICSDQHFFHKNIVDFTGCDPDRDNLMIKGWCNTVGADDTVIHLGDITLPGGGEQFERAVAPILPGKKFLVLGNHDKGKKGIPKHEHRSWYASMGFPVIKPFRIEYRGYTVFFSHRPGGDWKPFFQDTRIVDADPSFLQIHGHIHEKLVDHPRCINVCVEHTDYAPVHLKTLLDARIDTF